MRSVWLALSLLALAFAPCAVAQESAVLNPGFEQGVVGEPPAGWEFSEPGGAMVSPSAAYSGDRGLLISSDGSLTQRIAAEPFRNRRIRLTAWARADLPGDASGSVWLRLDGPGGRVPYLRYSSRPSRQWARYDVLVPVPANAESIAFGFSLQRGGWVEGGAWAHLDEVSIADVGSIEAGNAPPRPLTRGGLENVTALARLYGYVRYFHLSDEAASADWDALALAGAERVEGARTRTALQHALLDVFAPIAPGVVIVQGGRRSRLYHSDRRAAPAELPAFARLDLPRGLVAFVPLRLRCDADGRTSPAAFVAPLTPSKPTGFTPTGMDRTSRLAAVIQVWNVLQHFYPYFDVVDVDWEAELVAALRAAATDGDEAAFDLTLKRMIAALDDGHGAARRNEPRGRQPFRWEWIEDALVVTQTGEDTGVRVGDIVRRIDGRAVEDLIAAREALISSATPGFRRWVALGQIAAGDPGETRSMSVERNAALMDVQITLARWRHRFDPAPSNYDTVAEIEPGLVYIDLTRLTREEFEANVGRLAGAERLIFDLRGYPSNGWYDVIAHLAASQVHTAPMNAPTYTQPDRRGVTFEDVSWPIEPQTPHFCGRAVFITDGRAVSQAETVMSVVEGHRLGEIVGAATAGTNGDVDGVPVLTGHGIGWTGMQVLRHGGGRFHGVGVAPTIPAHRTIAGVRAGRDEVLEAAIAATRN